MNKHDKCLGHLATLVLALYLLGSVGNVALLLTSGIAIGLKTTTHHEWNKRASFCIFLWHFCGILIHIGHWQFGHSDQLGMSPPCGSRQPPGTELCAAALQSPAPRPAPCHQAPVCPFVPFVGQLGTLGTSCLHCPAGTLDMTFRTKLKILKISNIIKLVRLVQRSPQLSATVVSLIL